MSKNNKRSKMNTQIANELLKKGIIYHKNIQQLTKVITPTHKVITNIPITIRTDFKKHDIVADSINSSILLINNRELEIITLFNEILNEYTDLDIHLLCHSYNQLLNIGSKISNLCSELKYEVEKQLLLRDVALYESVTDYPEIFPKARNRKRKIIAYLGDTNSGKTYNAMVNIANAFF